MRKKSIFFISVLAVERISRRKGRRRGGGGGQERRGGGGGGADSPQGVASQDQRRLVYIVWAEKEKKEIPLLPPPFPRKKRHEKLDCSSFTYPHFAARKVRQFFFIRKDASPRQNLISILLATNYCMSVYIPVNAAYRSYASSS